MLLWFKYEMVLKGSSMEGLVPQTGMLRGRVFGESLDHKSPELVNNWVHNLKGDCEGIWTPKTKALFQTPSFLLGWLATGAFLSCPRPLISTTTCQTSGQGLNACTNLSSFEVVCPMYFAIALKIWLIKNIQWKTIYLFGRYIGRKTSTIWNANWKYKQYIVKYDLLMLTL